MSLDVSATILAPDRETCLVHLVVMARFIEVWH